MIAAALTRFRSYDPNSGTSADFGGVRAPCP
jgi:hypothetical protein